jgi:hypothetical protein
MSWDTFYNVWWVGYWGVVELLYLPESVKQSQAERVGLSGKGWARIDDTFPVGWGVGSCPGIPSRTFGGWGIGE